MWGNNTAPSGSGQNWTIYFDNATAPVPLFYCNTGMVVAVKSKFAGDAYNFVNTGGTGVTGTDVGFDHVTWQDEGRGAFRNITYAFVTNSAIVQRPAITESYDSQAWVLSTPIGGTQIGNVLDTSFSIANATVSNFTANTGDDSIAFFNDGYSSGTGTISTVTISNSFSRDINLYNSCHVALSGLSITGCNSQQFDVPTQYNGCVTDTDQLVQASWKVPECSPDYPL